MTLHGCLVGARPAEPSTPEAPSGREEFFQPTVCARGGLRREARLQLCFALNMRTFILILAAPASSFSPSVHVELEAGEAAPQERGPSSGLSGGLPVWVGGSPAGTPF